VLRDDEGRTLSRGTRPEAVLAERRYPLQPNIPGAYGVGELTVIIGPDELVKKVLRRSLFSTITLLAALVACVMALVVMFRNQVTRHLVTMARHAANLRLDAFDQPLVLSGKLVDVPPDEIDQLAGSFQQMLARISADLKSMQRYEAELSAHRDHLEKLVQTRTIELEEKAKQLEEQRALQEKLANTDALTGTLSRRHFLELAERELARAGRTRESVAVIALDLDHFKVINDTYGHAGGDNVLRWFSRTCESQLRAIDLFGRIGGEEFAILLPNSDEASALRVAERLRSAIESLPVAIGDGRFHATTVSIGLATSSRDGETLDSLLAAADGALYDAKRAGRNRIMLASKA
jgi:diguanylate cyclase (GGDEF)-like protein